MSRKGIAPSVPSGTPNMDARVIYDFQIHSLEGKLLTLLESLGLTEKQETALKEVFKDIFYRQMYFETIYVYGEHLQPALEATAKEGGTNGRVAHS